MAKPKVTKVATSHIDKMFGQVVLIKCDMAGKEVPAKVAVERYATVTGIGGDHIVIEWALDSGLHIFARESGKCVESHAGRMRGYEIAPWEMDRFKGSKSA